VEEEAKTPLQSIFEKRKNTKNKDDESRVPCNQLTIKSWNGEEGGSPSYVCNNRHRYK